MVEEEAKGNRQKIKHLPITNKVSSLTSLSQNRFLYFSLLSSVDYTLILLILAKIAAFVDNLLYFPVDGIVVQLYEHLYLLLDSLLVRSKLYLDCKKPEFGISKNPYSLVGGKLHSFIE
ncbi:MAG: hypothetical protein ACRC06_17730 [Waterburya sp.]